MTYQEIIKLWKSKQLDTVNELDEALQNFRIIFAYHSGVIENPEITYHNTREIFENGKLVNYTGDLRTVFEMKNQKNCYDFLKEKIIAKEPLRVGLIKEVHEQLMHGTYDERRWERGERPGEFKVHDYVVGNDQGALPEEVPGEVEELCEEIAEIPDVRENILRTAAYLHCKFENIHPFADGNGRVGRTIMNYYLMIHNYPPLVVHNETKDRYYQALGCYDQTGDINPFVDYMKDSLEQSWERHRAPEKNLTNFLEYDELEPEL